MPLIARELRDKKSKSKIFSELQIIEVNENSSPAFSDSFSAQLNGPLTPNPAQNTLAVPNKSASQFSYNTLGKFANSIY